MNWTKMSDASVFSRRRTRLYSVFVRKGKGWERVSAAALRLDDARKAFQPIILGLALGGQEVQLRPVSDKR